MSTLTSSISATVTALQVTDPIETLRQGEVLRIDDEAVLFLGYTWNGTYKGANRRGRFVYTTWNVQRGYIGTTATTHAGGTEIMAASDAFVSADDLTPPDPFSATSSGDPVAVLSTTVSLTDAQIKSLGGLTHLEIVAAPGVGKMLVLIWAALGPLSSGATDYTNVNVNAEAKFVYGDPADEDASRAAGIASNILALIDTKFYFVEYGSLAAYNGQINRTQATENKALYLLVTNGGDGDFAGGDAGNTLPVTVIYSIVDIF